MRRAIQPRWFLAAILPVFAWGTSLLHAQTPTAAVVATIQIPDADIVGLSVGAEGELAVYDRTDGVSNTIMRFFQASMDEGVPVVTEMPETVAMAGDAPHFKGWMARANGLLYALAETRPTTSWSRAWSRMWIYVIADRSYVGAIGYNSTSTVNGGEPAKWPEDFWYGVNGFVVEPKNSEGTHNARIIIDDTIKGNLDILDLDSFGTGLVSQLRYSYRPRLESDCDWPDLDPNLVWYDCHWDSIIGSGAALEWYLETFAGPTNPLATTDEFYLLDPNYSKNFVRRFELSHPGVGVISATELSGVDIAAETLGLGAESVHGAPKKDRLWIATGTQSNTPIPDRGVVPVVNTVTQSVEVLDPVYADRHTVLVDPVDQAHVIIPVSDSSLNPSSLILRELRDGFVINSVTALTDFDRSSLRAAAYDRGTGLVYLAIKNGMVADTLYAVAATEAMSDDLIFANGFESGNIDEWSAAVP